MHTSSFFKLNAYLQLSIGLSSYWFSSSGQRHRRADNKCGNIFLCENCTRPSNDLQANINLQFGFGHVYTSSKKNTKINIPHPTLPDNYGYMLDQI